MRSTTFGVEDGEEALESHRHPPLQARLQSLPLALEIDVRQGLTRTRRGAQLASCLAAAARRRRVGGRQGAIEALVISKPAGGSMK